MSNKLPRVTLRTDVLIQLVIMEASDAILDRILQDIEALPPEEHEDGEPGDRWDGLS